MERTAAQWPAARLTCFGHDVVAEHKVDGLAPQLVPLIHKGHLLPQLGSLYAEFSLRQGPEKAGAR